MRLGERGGQAAGAGKIVAEAGGDALGGFGFEIRVGDADFLGDVVVGVEPADVVDVGPGDGLAVADIGEQAVGEAILRGDARKQIVVGAATGGFRTTEILVVQAGNRRGATGARVDRELGSRDLRGGERIEFLRACLGPFPAKAALKLPCGDPHVAEQVGRRDYFQIPFLVSEGGTEIVVGGERVGEVLGRSDKRLADRLAIRVGGRAAAGDRAEGDAQSGRTEDKGRGEIGEAPGGAAAGSVVAVVAQAAGAVGVQDTLLAFVAEFEEGGQTKRRSPAAVHGDVVDLVVDGADVVGDAGIFVVEQTRPIQAAGLADVPGAGGDRRAGGFDRQAAERVDLRIAGHAVAHRAVGIL